MLDIRCWILDTGCWILDTGYWILDAGCWIRLSTFSAKSSERDVA